MQCGKPPMEPRAHAWHLGPEMPSRQRQVPVCGSQLGEMEPWGSQAQAVPRDRVRAGSRWRSPQPHSYQAWKRKIALCERGGLS